MRGFTSAPCSSITRTWNYARSKIRNNYVFSLVTSSAALLLFALSARSILPAVSQWFSNASVNAARSSNAIGKLLSGIALLLAARFADWRLGQARRGVMPILCTRDGLICSIAATIRKTRASRTTATAGSKCVNVGAMATAICRAFSASSKIWGLALPNRQSSVPMALALMSRETAFGRTELFNLAIGDHCGSLSMGATRDLLASGRKLPDYRTSPSWVASSEVGRQIVPSLSPFDSARPFQSALDAGVWA